MSNDVIISGLRGPSSAVKPLRGKCHHLLRLVTRALVTFHLQPVQHMKKTAGNVRRKCLVNSFFWVAKHWTFVTLRLTKGIMFWTESGVQYLISIWVLEIQRDKLNLSSFRRVVTTYKSYSSKEPNMMGKQVSFCCWGPQLNFAHL